MSILEKQTMSISTDFKSKKKTIEITKEDIQNLDRRIKEDVKENEDMRQATYNHHYPRNKCNSNLEKDR